MQALLDLSSPSNILEGLKRFHDVIESHIRSLISLGKSTETNKLNSYVATLHVLRIKCDPI